MMRVTLGLMLLVGCGSEPKHATVAETLANEAPADAAVADAAPAPPDATPQDPKAATHQFLDKISQSRAAIEACYLEAVKATAMPGKPLTLTVTASFSATGKYDKIATSPGLGEPFNTCLTDLALTWDLGAMPYSMTFKAQVSVTP